MNTENAFNAVFWTLLGLMLLMRVWFAFQVWRTGERIRADREARRREGFWAHAVAYLFLLLLVALAADFLFRGGSLRRFAFPTPGWLRWTGVGLGIASLGLFVWTHVALGRFWSPYVQLRPGHRVITAGPYARIRHPMYCAIVGWMTSLGLVAANWIPLACAALGALQFFLRIRGEEKVMSQEFGDEYREYVKRTGRGWVIAASVTALILGVLLSRVIEPGVRVETVTLTGNTPAIQFFPATPGPHPVALLAHGYAGSKETLFRYGEALAAAGFICYSVDQPGHGASPRTLTFMEAVHTLEAVAREVGPVDVFAGQSMGGGTGGEAVREGGMRPGLFIAIGAMPVLGDHAPPLLLLAGRFEEAFPPALLKTRTDARLVISPWSDHMLEGFDPVLVNAAVGAACAAVHKAPPPPPTAWRWRLIGVVLAMVAAGGLASGVTDLFPQWARFRGVFIGTFIVAAFMLTVGGRWLEGMPHLRSQVIATPVILLLAIIAGRLRIPRWSFAGLSVLVTVFAVCWFKASLSRPALILMASTLVLTPALIAGIVIGWFAARRASRLQGDIAMAIFLGCAPFQCLELPRTAPQVPTPHTAVKLDSRLLDACVGEYEFPPDNAAWFKWKMTFRRQGDQLLEQITTENKSYPAVEMYPESETKFFVTAKDPHELTFVNNDKGEMTAVIVRFPGIPVREGKKLKNR